MTEVMFVWAALGDRNVCPDRIEVVVCEHCACLVAVDTADQHARYHRLVDSL